MDILLKAIRYVEAQQLQQGFKSSLSSQPSREEGGTRAQTAFLDGRSFARSSDARGSVEILPSSSAFSSVSRPPQRLKTEDNEEQKPQGGRRWAERCKRARFRDTLEKLRRCTAFDPPKKPTNMDILLNAISYVEGLDALLLQQGYMSASAQPAISDGRSFEWSSDAGDSATWDNLRPEAVQDRTSGPASAQPAFSDDLLGSTRTVSSERCLA
uniref:BHLH domain-containing protein n=1 Tax=Oryzias latipes TaxID=8090 RepID=A0A3B3IHA7_ORYLA